jgi:polyferredoxin
VRDRASLARLVGEGQVENLYRLQIMNATEQAQRYRVAVSGVPGIGLAAPIEVELQPAEARWVTAAVRIDAQSLRALQPGAHPMAFSIELHNAGVPGASVVEKSTFVVPR